MWPAMGANLCTALRMGGLAMAFLQGGGRAGSQATERRRYLEALARCCQVCSAEARQARLA